MNDEQKNTDQTNQFENTKLEELMLAQLEKLNDPNCNMEEEIKRTNAFVTAGTVLVNAAKVKVDMVRVTQLIKKNNLLEQQGNKKLPPAGAKTDNKQAQ